MTGLRPQDRPSRRSSTTLARVGRKIAVAVSVSQATETDTRAYVSAQLPGVGRLVSFVLPAGPGQQNVAGGGHAAALAEQIANELRALKVTDPDATVHIFAACPNSILV